MYLKTNVFGGPAGRKKKLLIAKIYYSDFGVIYIYIYIYVYICIYTGGPLPPTPREESSGRAPTSLKLIIIIVKMSVGLTMLSNYGFI